ncbi:Epsin-3, clathrin recruitment and traffic between the Golgi and endosome [Vermiconidia calcicola]|uniref:Epsin-3, clathrin recruitment and traffic between the Golgi and endosome n=1 Tax=Vermiconidia calcicola TaxID=1690605 RepID=A0ACC3NYZ6_9PEZI|nr:Epsin-3, clathrin recruitment and traffic between the Golgi and endosome [Vermiconidia calcicola]
MDWNALKTDVSNLTLYDLKAGVRKIQNQVMNYTEMESKVREATNNEPWGASSSMMQEIANGTFNYQLLNEIMPMIYKRFTEKSAEEWRQIYKALQLMEFLVKNGSERVIDDARSHLSLLKMLRQFHYIDQNGKDQGINVRNRSKELTDLLSDVERIRSERKKARQTKNKYTGVEGGASFGLGGSGSSARYGGFGSESAGAGGSYGASTRGVYGDGGGFGGETHEEYDESGRRGGAERFEEYDEGDDGGAQPPPARRKAEPARSSRSTAKKAEPAKPKEPEVDLFEFGDEPATTAPTISAPSNGTSSSAILSPPASSNILGDDDDFDDFQSATPAASAPAPAPLAAPAIPAPNYSSISTAAPTSNTHFAQATPQQGSQKAEFSNLFSTASRPSSTAATVSAFSPPPLAQQPKSAGGYQPTGPNYFTSVQVQPGQQQAVGTPGSVTSPSAGRTPAAAAGKKPAGGDAFASLLGGAAVKKSGTPTQKVTMADMAKQKSQAGLYGANAPAALQQPAAGIVAKPSTGSSGLDDLLG